MEKPWYYSKTLWFNLIVAIFAVLESQTAALAQVIGPQAYPYAALLVAGGNAILRVFTNGGITAGK